MPKLLIVEESDILCDMFKRLLDEDAGFNYEIVKTYKEASVLLSKYRYEYAVVSRTLIDAKNGEIIALLNKHNVAPIVYTDVMDEDLIENFEIANTAKELGLVEIDLDLLLVGRETRPLADALAFTSQPFIEGLTWNREACFSLLKSSGVNLKEESRWRVPADLNEEEKRQVIESITKFASGKNATELMSELIGYTYTFPREDSRSFLRDGREFSTMLNSCGRINRSGVGMAVCMGDRNKILREAETILTDYRKMIREYMNILSNERWRISESETCVMVNGEDIVPETMTGTISSLIAGSPKNSGKIVILRTKAEENTIKFSSRKSFGCTSDINLSEIMRNGAEKFDGIGGGHNAAAGAKITKDKLDEFLNYLEVNVVNVSSSGNSQ